MKELLWACSTGVCCMLPTVAVGLRHGRLLHVANSCSLLLKLAAVRGLAVVAAVSTTAQWFIWLLIQT